jgi:hypothetical protein
MLEHAIRQRAYDLYLKRGGADGHDVDDWLEAEAELVQGALNVGFQRAMSVRSRVTDSPKAATGGQ